MINRLLCALFGHKDKLEAEYELKDSSFVYLYTCKRCGRGDWAIIWKGHCGMIAMWDRALTADEIRMLCEIEEDKDE